MLSCACHWESAGVSEAHRSDQQAITKQRIPLDFKLRKRLLFAISDRFHHQASSINRATSFRSSHQTDLISRFRQTANWLRHPDRSTDPACPIQLRQSHWFNSTNPVLPIQFHHPSVHDGQVPARPAADRDLRAPRPCGPDESPSGLPEMESADRWLCENRRTGHLLQNEFRAEEVVSSQ